MMAANRRLAGIAWPDYTHRTAVIIMIAGASTEVLSAVLGTVFRLLYLGEGALFPNLSWLYSPSLVLNSVISFLGALVLTYGALAYIQKFEMSLTACRALYCALGFFVCYRAFEVLQTYQHMFIKSALSLRFDLDTAFSILLLVASGFTLLLGMMRALHDSNQSRKLLQEQNIRLDREVQERLRSECQVRASRKRFSAILNALSSPIFLCCARGFVLAHNEVFGQLHGNGKKSLVGMNLRDLLPGPVFETGRKLALKALAENSPNGHTLCLDNRYWEVHIYPMPAMEDGEPCITSTESSATHCPHGTQARESTEQCITVLATDVTERLHHEQERRLLETAISSAAESILVTDADGHIEYVNPAFETQSGYARHEVMGRTPALLKSGKHEDGYYRELWETLTRGEVWRGQLINRRKDGDLSHENTTISPIVNENRIITHYVAVKRDVTREHNLEKQLQHAHKVKSVGTLAGGIAHDLNNVLAIIMGRGELARDLLDPHHEARESLDVIIRTANRSSKLIKRLLAFTRQSAGETGPLVIAPLVKEQTKVIRAFLPSNIQVVETIRLDREVVIADPSEIQQIIVNLFNNAHHAMQPDGGEIKITLDRLLLEEPFTVTTGTLKPGDYVRLSVGDSGCGMEREVLDHIFDPFFTTKDVDEGSGLGLAMIYGSVTRMGGQIQVFSTPGKGSVFDIYFPEAPTESVPEVTKPERISGDGISVLLIDDIDDFAELLRLNLQNHGYRVSAFSEATEAVAFFKNNPMAIDVAVVDYMMPHMNGKQVAEALHEQRSDLPVLLLTGYAGDITSENAHLHGFGAICEKPVEIDHLSRALADLVRRAGVESPAGNAVV